MSSPDKRRRVDSNSPRGMDTAAPLPTSLFTEAEHDELDTLVNHELAKAADAGQHTSPAEIAVFRPETLLGRMAAALVIGIVITHSKDRLRSELGSFTDPMDPPLKLQTLLREEPGLVSAALAAAAMGKFKDIRENFAILSARHLEAGSNLSPEATELQRDAVEKSWQVDFKGDSAKFFLEILRNYQLEPHAAFYAKYVTITQSSGMGKSRMVDEAGREVTSIPVNLSRAQRTCLKAASRHI
ncbi:hypothetical protein CPB85DRAFT_1331639 [Mucidula mucida]|nr:hypothetical protein CPB85DRAFT_1331639 [Mucidula mucida]